MLESGYDVADTPNPGPIVSGSVPVNLSDKHVAGTQRSTHRNRSPLKGTVNQGETAEARASLWTPENRRNKQGATMLCNCILLKKLSVSAFKLSDLYLPAVLAAMLLNSPDFAYSGIRD